MLWLCGGDGGEDGAGDADNELGDYMDDDDGYDDAVLCGGDGGEDGGGHADDERGDYMDDDGYDDAVLCGGDGCEDGAGDADNELADYMDDDDGYDDAGMVLEDSSLRELSHYCNFSPTSASSGINYIISIFTPYFFRYSVVGLTHPS